MVRLMTLVPLLSLVSAWSCYSLELTANKRFPDAAVYLICKSGLIRKYDGQCLSFHEVQTEGFHAEDRVCDADMTDEGDTLFLAVSSCDAPYVTLNADTLVRHCEPCISLPHYSLPWQRHAPRKVIAIDKERLLVEDEAYSGGHDPFSILLVDLASRKVTPLRDLYIPSRSSVIFSPGRNAAFIACRARISALDLADGCITHYRYGLPDDATIRVVEFAVEHSGSAVTSKVHVSSDEASAYDLRLDVARGTQSENGMPPPRRWTATFRENSTVAFLLLAYARGQRQYRGEWPILDSRLELMLERIGSDGLCDLPRNIDMAFVSADGRYVATVRLPAAVGGTGQKEDESSVAVLDLESGHLVRPPIDIAEEIVSILF